MRILRPYSVPVGLVALWAVLLLTGGAGRQAQAPVVTTTAPQPTTVHAPTDAGTLGIPTRPFSAAANVRPSGSADGEPPVGPAALSSTSSVRGSRLTARVVDPGRRACRAQSCAVLCVFLC
ncbi:MAG: hypothetical protein ABEL97_00575 [Salinibacter sp.]